MEPMETVTTAPWERRTVVILLLAFVALGLTYSIVNPLFEATDELRHYRFVRTLVEKRALPVQGQEVCRSQSHHPPLIYALGALATAWVPGTGPICLNLPENPFWAYRYWDVGVDNKNQYLHGSAEAFPWRGDALAAHIVRALNVLVGAGTVWITWAIGRAIWPRRPWLALGGMAFVAFNPMFLYMAGAINNDVIAAFSGGLVVLVCLRLLRAPEGLHWRWGIGLGATYALALMSKFNLAAVGLLVGLTATWVAWRRRQWRAWLAVAGVALGVTALLAGWWFARNLALYGDPTGFQELTELWGVRDPRQSLGLAVSELPYAWSTLWGRFGFGQIPLPDGVYQALALVAAIGLIGGLARGLLAESATRPAMLLLIVDVALFFAVLFSYMLVSPAGPMGRFFFPALPALAVLLFAGWHRLLRGGEAGGRRLAVAAHAAMGLFAVGALVFILAPAYARPPSFAGSDALPAATAIRFDSFVELRGYELAPTRLRPGEPLDVALYWEVTGRPPGDYLFFLHLIDPATDALAAQRDTHPGLGRFPSSQWQPGDRFVDRVRVYLPETAYAPAQATVQIGLYAPEGYRLAVRDAAGEALGDALALGDIAIEPHPGPYPNPQDHNFNGELRLEGYDLEPRRARVGASIAVRLYWEVLRDLRPGRVVQVHLLDEAGQVVATADRPAAMAAPEREAGRTVLAEHVLPTASLPAGTYRVEVALLDPAAGRLPIVAPDGHWIDERLVLPRVRLDP